MSVIHHPPPGPPHTVLLIVVGILVLFDPRGNLRRRGEVPLRVLGSGVDVEVPLVTVAEDPFLNCKVHVGDEQSTIVWNGERNL